MIQRNLDDITVAEIVGSCSLEGIRLSDSTKTNVVAAVKDAAAGALIRQRLVAKYKAKAKLQTAK